MNAIEYTTTLADTDLIRFADDVRKFRGKINCTEWSDLLWRAICLARDKPERLQTIGLALDRMLLARIRGDVRVAEPTPIPAFREEECGTFDGTNVTSDADPGL